MRIRVLAEILLCISKYFFEENMKKKLTTVNFLAVLCDGSMDKSVTEQDVVYVTFADPETGNLLHPLQEVVAPSKSQEAPGFKKAIIYTFKRNFLESIIEKILSSIGASVNCRKHSGMIKLFQEDYPWVFVWCISHRLVLALKDAVKEVLGPVNASICDLHHLYVKSSKKHEN